MNPSYDFENQVALVTGAASGMGLATSQAFAAAGAAVVLADVDKDAVAAAPAVGAGLVEFGSRVRFWHPLVRSAAYRAASFEDRQNRHMTDFIRGSIVAAGARRDPQRPRAASYSAPSPSEVSSKDTG
jgi:NAD(P)-dependent dehydrogenase (short-subunit alcohol dehydrogenase family)